jgi:hypothetical protein
VLFAVPIYLFARERQFLLHFIPNEGLRSIVIFLFDVLPTFAYGQGKLRADDIIEGRRFDYVLSEIDQIPVSADASAVQRVRYLGHSGDFFFSLNPTTSALVITKFKDDKALLLKHFDAALVGPVAK